jgi:aryl-alcohol dehydrogenase-like predicted oxidoreductase
VEYRQLGLTGIEVSRIALGCGNFGGIGSAPAFFGQGENREEAFALMDAAWAAGITLFDTADAYGGGRSETWVGEWIATRAIRPLLTTKVFHSVAGDPDDRGLAPRRIRRQLAASLERLGLELIDLYLTHEPDPETPFEDTLSTLAELVREGSVRAIGLSNATADELDRALEHAPVSCVQNSYSLLDQSSADVVDLCAERGVAFTAFSPLAGGWLTGKYRRGEPVPAGSRMALRPEGQLHLVGEETYSALDALASAAAVRGVDLATLAYAWLAADPRVTSIVVGPRRPEHLEAPLAALDVELTPDERDALAALFLG